MALLKMIGLLSNRYALVEGSSKLRLLVEVGLSDPEKVVDPALNLTLVVDRSTSMTGDALDNVKKAASHLIDSLKETDYVSVVGFSDQVSVVAPSQPVSDRASIKQSIDQLFASGATNIYEAVDIGRREAMRHFSADKVNRIVLLSDGEATAGVLEDDRILALADSSRTDGLSLSTLGVGEEYDEVLLGQLARRGGGNHYFIRTPEAIPQIFTAELSKMKSVVAKNLKIRVKPADGTQVRMLNQRYRCETINEEFFVHLDEHEAGRPQVTILEVEVSARAEGDFCPATLDLTYDNLVDHVRGESLTASLQITFVADSTQIRSGINREVLRRWEELSAMQELKWILDRVKDRRIDSKTAVMELDRKTQVLVKKKAIDTARVFAQVGKTIVEEGGVSTTLSKRTMVACEEAEKGCVTGKTLLEDE